MADEDWAPPPPGAPPSDDEEGDDWAPPPPGGPPSGDEGDEDWAPPPPGGPPDEEDDPPPPPLPVEPEPTPAPAADPGSLADIVAHGAETILLETVKSHRIVINEDPMGIADEEDDVPPPPPAGPPPEDDDDWVAPPPPEEPAPPPSPTKKKKKKRVKSVLRRKFTRDRFPIWARGMAWMYEEIRIAVDTTPGGDDHFGSDAKRWLAEREDFAQCESSQLDMEMQQRTKERVVEIAPVRIGDSSQPQTLAEVFNHQKLLLAFRCFLEDGYNTEDLDFLESVRAFKDCPSEKERSQQAASIAQWHMKEESEQKVAFPDETLRDKLLVEIEANEILGESPVTIFDTVVTQIEERLTKQVLFDFFKSKDYEEAYGSPWASAKVGHGWVNDAGFKTLKVFVERAKKLKMPSGGGGRDVFVEISVDSALYHSETAEETLNPFWRENFEFELLDTTQFVIIKIRDASRSNELVGSCCIPLECVQPPYDLMKFDLGEKDHPTAATQVRSPVGSISVKLNFSHDVVNESREHAGAEAQRTSTNRLRRLVSKKKERFVQDGFDLDLTYITPNVLAMGFPSRKIEGMYRNNIKDVKRFLEFRHPNRYMVYNLCSERWYDADEFQGRVMRFPFDDHNACPFLLLVEFCNQIEQLLKLHPQACAAVHCKAGKGRTGLVISCYLIKSGVCKDAEEAMLYYGTKRTKNKQGVTIPSQRRYVEYFSTYHSRLTQKLPDLPNEGKYLRKILIHTTKGLGKSPFFVLYCESVKALEKFSSKSCKKIKRKQKKSTIYGGKSMFEFDCGQELAVHQDVKIVFYSKGVFGKETLFQLWMHTQFVEGDKVVLRKKFLDRAHKDTRNKLFDKDVTVELFFGADPKFKATSNKEAVAKAEAAKKALSMKFSANSGPRLSRLKKASSLRARRRTITPTEPDSD